MGRESQKRASIRHRRFDTRVLLQFFALFCGSFIVGLLFIHSSIVYYRSKVQYLKHYRCIKAFKEMIEVVF
eukprot:m.24325 g.24325  ORF g.24325 m.24325 type:complete len:71 (+) comp28605_c0_seq2:83-295(+)